LTGAPPVLKSGFTYAMTTAIAGPVDCNTQGTFVTYYVTATPTSFASTGNRSFASNQAGAIWQNSTATPPAEPFTVGADTPIQ